MEFDGKTEKELTRDDIKAPEGWLWKTDWAIDKNRAVDEEGVCACVCMCWRSMVKFVSNGVAISSIGVEVIPTHRVDLLVQL